MHGQWFDALDHETQADYAEPDADPPTLHARLVALLAELRARHAADPAHYPDPARVAAAARVLAEGSIVPFGVLLWFVRDADGRRWQVDGATRRCTCGGAALGAPCLHLAAVDLLQYPDLSEREE
jgi:hypothetical protein